MEAILATVHTVQASYQRAHREIKSSYLSFPRGCIPCKSWDLISDVAFQRLSEEFFTAGDRDVAYWATATQLA